MLHSNYNANQFYNFATKRIFRDLQEIQNEPIPWVSICMPNIQNPFLLRGNIMIQDGIYKGVLIHVIIRLPNDYPLSPPAANIVPGHPFTHEFHEHVFTRSSYGGSICTDLLSNFSGFFNKFEANGKPMVSGWTPVYTLSSILIQLQIFFADPDLPERWLPPKEKISKMKKETEEFSCEIEMLDGNENKIVCHSYKQPYPPLHNQNKDKIEEEDENQSRVNSTKKEPAKMKKERAKITPKQKITWEEIESIAPEDGWDFQTPENSKQMKFEVCNKIVCPVTKKRCL